MATLPIRTLIGRFAINPCGRRRAGPERLERGMS
jgi:hypothetical protein